MNRDEILNMEAGREMDALVAEKVMGWALKTVWIGSEEHKRLIAPERHYMPDDYPWYSTDIAAAWQVVEKMKWWKAENDLSTDGSVMWHFRVGEPPNHEWFSAEGDTAPLAICRAALKAIEEGGE